METKICVRCNQEKPLSEFRPQKAKCIDCGNELRREAWNNRTEEQKKHAVERMNKWNENNKDKRKLIYLRQRDKKRLSCRIFIKTCALTGALFIAKRKDIKYSNEGRKMLNNKRANIRYRKKTGCTRTCPICGKEYEYFKKKVYCSDECRLESRRMVDRNSKHKQRISGNKRNRVLVLYKLRVKQLYEKIDDTKVFNRDKWRCQMCNIKTPKQMKGTNALNAPTLDHIVPLSKGGSHTYSNVQCLCRSCNSSKCDQLIGQLNLCI